MTAQTIRICFVCLGNICRSPTAEGVMRQLVRAAGLEERFTIASAGTGAWHIGHPADPRSRAEALRRGLELDGKARQFGAADFADFDYVVAMDGENRRDLERLAPDALQRGKVHLLRSFDPKTRRDLDVPDPYQEGPEGFSRVYEICQAGCEGLLAHLRANHAL
jgi:protein-tyrosine phosphatase